MSMIFIPLMCPPLILGYRCIVWLFVKCFAQKKTVIYDFQLCLNELEHDGGWFRDNRYLQVSVRDTFYIYTVQKMKKKLNVQKLIRFVNKLANNMSNDGHVPWCFQKHWLGDEIPLYKYENVSVIDANMQFIIMVHWLYELDEQVTKTLYLYCQRAWQWLDINRANDTLHEAVCASWETSRHHKGVLLLSNVIMIHAIRCMELVHMYEKNERKLKQFQKLHERAISTWTPEIYKTQETLPRILAVYYNIVPRSFIKSFNQEIQSVWIPCRVDGPIKNIATTTAWLHGYTDQHDTVIWPWIGFMWILILSDRGLHDIATSWWTSYMEFHVPDNLYDIYDQETGKPIRRAFLKGHGSHALTIATWLAAQEKITDELI